MMTTKKIITTMAMEIISHLGKSETMMGGVAVAASSL
jgi:hypothetical protein